MTALLILYVVAVTLVWELLLSWRRRSTRLQTYALLLAANLLLCVFTIITRWVDGPLFFFAIGMFVFLVVIPGLLGAAVRRALIRDRIDWALLFAGMRRTLQPSLAAIREREMLEMLALVRNGRTDEAIHHLLDAASRAGAIRRVELHEQIVAALCFDRRFEEAVRYFEAHLPPAAAAARPAMAANLVRAYAEIGNLIRAAEILGILETGPAAQDPTGIDLINQARVMFLALAGRYVELDQLFADGRLLRNAPDRIRTYWHGVALLAAGEQERGRSELLRARAMADDDERLREAVNDRLQRTAPTALPADIDDLAATIVQRASRARALPQLRGRAWRIAPATAALVGFLVLAYGAVLMAGSTTSTWTLVKAGAQFLPAIHAGESWRLISATFLHAGILHLVLNTYGLWLLGRFVEQVYGATRFVAVYVLSGICGFAASAMIAKVPLTVGASGCIFGLLGASIAIFFARRGSWPETWRRGALSSLLFFTAVNLAIGFVFPMIDNAAHVGGLLSGAALGFVMIPGGILGYGRRARAVAAGLAALATSALLYGAFGLATSHPNTLFERIDTRRTQLGRVELKHPSYWLRDISGESAQLRDPIGAVLAVHTLPAPLPLDQALTQAFQEEMSQKDLRVGRVTEQPQAGRFVGRQVEFEIIDENVRQAYQVWVAQASNRDIVLIEISFPWDAREAYQPLIRDMLQSATLL